MTQASTSNLNLTLMRIVFDDCSDGRSWRRIPKRSSEEVESARGGGVGRGPSSTCLLGGDVGLVSSAIDGRCCGFCAHVTLNLKALHSIITGFEVEVK